jgi:hypothetical protein
MIQQISKILAGFERCFSRKAAFYWFVIIVFGLLVRLDLDGVSSFIRWLGLNPGCYTALLNFFRAMSWNLANIQSFWQAVVLDNCPPISINDCLVLVGDGIKVSKEAYKMPGVKRLHQESNNSGKPPYIFGHHFGVLGILAGSATRKIFCVPLRAWLQEGLGKLAGDDEKTFNLITSMTSNAIQLAHSLKEQCCLLVLDAFYAVGPCFLAFKELFNPAGQRLIHVITRAKSNVVAYHDPEYSGRGRPPDYGQKVKLSNLFETCREQFHKATLTLYSKPSEISYLCLDLIWRPVRDKIRFVLVIDQENCFILMCSNLMLAPVDIIIAYSYRFKIEVCFNVLKNLIGAFFYHFWTTVWPKLCRKSNVSIELPTDTRSRRLIREAISAIESFVNFGCIATGVLQILALNFPQKIWSSYQGWLRTISSEAPSEETVRSVIWKEFYHNFHLFSNSLIYQVIIPKTRKDYFDIYESAS